MLAVILVGSEKRLKDALKFSCSPFLAKKCSTKNYSLIRRGSRSLFVLLFGKHTLDMFGILCNYELFSDFVVRDMIIYLEQKVHLGLIFLSLK